MDAAANETDVVIAGGGMVGLPLALALAQGGLRVAVAEPVSAETLAGDAFDGRVSALAYASVRMFGALNLWPRLAADAQPIHDIVVSDAPLGRPASPFSLHFDHSEIGEPLGHIVENRHIRRALLAAVAEEPRVSLLGGVTVDGLQRHSDRMEVRLSGGRVLRTRLAVGADGRDSQLREAQGIGVVAWDYPQMGIVTTVAHELPHHGVAYEHFLPSGPFAILPITGNRASLVWTEAADKARGMLSLSDAEFAEAIALRFGAHLGRVTPIGPRWSYPLRLQLARSYIAPRFALVGDAAHTIHPIAGQGLNLGLKDVAALAESVLDRARLGLDFGDLETLQRYERWRRFDSFVLAAGTDAVNRLFSNDVGPLRLARDLGLGIVDRIAPFRRFFMRHAGGDVGRLPRLFRGEAA
jgi:2-octaprenyl-6-methoxyphenol hydroxylase